MMSCSRPMTPAQSPFLGFNDSYAASSSSTGIPTNTERAHRLTSIQPSLPAYQLDLPEPAIIQYYPTVSDIPSPSDSPLPPPVCHAKLVPHSCPSESKKRDAYSCLPPDPDESWSTLPPRKKAKPRYETSYPMRLPTDSPSIRPLAFLCLNSDVTNSACQ